MKTGITLAFAAITALGGSSFLSGVHVPFISGGYAPPAECLEWYNGCNICQQAQGGGTTCTNRICTDSGKGFCMQYATSTAQGQ